jgi:rhomboid family GlyGly-CTERM serine protease
VSRATRGWIALAALLGAAALGARSITPEALDWEPGRALAEPWRAFSAVAVHYSVLHLAANLAGTALVGALGAVAGVPMRATWAWAAAWPLTQLGLLLRPDLLHYGGLSGVLHAGVAVVAVDLLLAGPRARRGIGAVLALGLLLKVLAEAPWGPALRHPAGWDIATAPFAHASGLVAGTVCALAAECWARRRIRRAAAAP